MFHQLMVSKEWRSTWNTIPEGNYAYGSYKQIMKDCAISGFMARSTSIHDELQEQHGSGSDFKRVMEVIKTRFHKLKSYTLIIAVEACDCARHMTSADWWMALEENFLHYKVGIADCVTVPIIKWV
ncbi:hypothetical protein GUJ93_ZPchr0012g18951 [Zizania palustris]|uniref:Uncharacterized protein n=1 Tax=Zizania palustris TaxID=103762 RepID=A0A8J5WUA1_ZIZPA|nr:hypothetical protein GUJ93_ZPchr0012g18951 [Zizania palustris]